MFDCIDILDYGLNLYRRAFAGFVLITAVWFVPVFLAIGITIAAVEYQNDTIQTLVALLWMVLFLLLAVYLVGGLSRATLTAHQGKPVRLREVFAISPLRVAGMGCYGTIFSLIASTVSATLSMLCFCPAFFVLSITLGGVGNALDETTGLFGLSFMVIFGVFIMLAFILFYGLSLVISGATYCSMIYALQPFVQEQRPFGESIERSINLLFHRFGQNLRAFLLSSFLFAAVAVSVTVAIGVLLPLPLIWSLGAESLIAQGVGATAWLLGLVLVLPPLPIWMALLYQQNQRMYDGVELASRIAAMGDPEGEPQPHPC